MTAASNHVVQGITWVAYDLVAGRVMKVTGSRLLGENDMGRLSFRYRTRNEHY